MGVGCWVLGLGVGVLTAACAKSPPKIERRLVFSALGFGVCGLGDGGLGFRVWRCPKLRGC